MPTDDLARAILVLLTLLLPLSALVARRLPLGRLVGMTLGWIGLFLAGYLLFTFFEPHINNWKQANRGGTVRVTPDGGAASGPVGASAVAGGAVEIPVGPDGHYWVEASVNGSSLRFLVDSGASITGVSDATAERLGLVASPMDATMTIQTANGSMTARRMTIPAMNIGPIQVSDLPVAVSAGLGDVNILGMNFLAKLKSWRVEDGRMILQPR